MCSIKTKRLCNIRKVNKQTQKIFGVIKYKPIRNKRSSGCILQVFIRSTFKTWKTTLKEKTILHLILVGIPSILMLFVNKRGWFFLLSRQNLLSVTKVICRHSLTFAELRTPQDSRAETKVPKFLLDGTLHLKRNYGDKREVWPSGLVTIV